MEAHRERAAPHIGDEIGRGLEDRLEELARLLLLPFEEGPHPASQLRLGPIGDHLEGIGEPLALALQLDDLLGVEDWVEWHFLGQGLSSLLEALNVVLLLLQERVHFVFAERAPLHPQGIAGFEDAPAAEELAQ